MSTIDDLLTQRRRGALSDADERRLQMAVQTSREHQLTLLAGEVFERAGVPQSNDAALIRSIVRHVEGEWSGTFQRVVTRPGLSRWVSVPVLIAGVAAASWGGYRALNAAGRTTVALAPPARPAPASLGTSSGVPSGVPSSAAAAPPARPPAPLVAAPLAQAAPFEQAAPLEQEQPAPLGTAAPAAIAAGAPATAAAPVSAATAAPAVAARRSTPSWNLPKPKPRAVRHEALDTDVGAVLPMPPLASAAGSASGTEADTPDLESARALFRRASELRQSDWDAAAALYERLALRHTESREAGVAEMALGKHALSEGRALRAVQWFEAYQRREGGELAAEALWGEARALQSLGETQRAKELWARLIEQYPASAYAAAAREQLGP